MKDLPYHHLPDGTFRNPEGSPVRDSSFNWSFKIFNKEKKKLNMSVPSDHVINKKEVLKNHLSFWLCCDYETILKRIKNSKKRLILFFISPMCSYTTFIPSKRGLHHIIVFF